MAASDDRNLAARVRGGDSSAAAALLARHQDSIFGVALRISRNAEEARDLTQETMVRALSRIDDYDSSRPFGPWVHRIARNLAIDRFRRKRPTSEFQEEFTQAGVDDRSSSAFARAADLVAHEGQVHAALHSCMKALPAPYREVIMLYHYDHLSYREIASALDIPQGTVMNRLFRARKKLGALMIERGVTP